MHASPLPHRGTEITEKIPSSGEEMAWLRLRVPRLRSGRGQALCASVVKICAKRTQFGPGVHVPARSNVQNEPNFRQAGRSGPGGLIPRPCGLGPSPGRVCETKPIPRLRTADRFPAGRPIVQNEPNLACRLGAVRGEMCKTNPICRSRSGADGGGAWYAPYERETKRAKRSQFPTRRCISYHSSIPLFHHSSVPSFPSTWTPEADCANNGGLDRLRSFPEAG